jgi:hypothetical protein
MSQPPPGYGPPYEPLAYALPMEARPGILTAVGVISIVVGGISALASVAGIASGIAYIAMAKMQVKMAMPAATTMPAFQFNIARGASVLMIVESGLSACAAVLLIVAGSLMLRNWPRADRLHRIYVAVKIPLIATAAIATWWIYSGMMSGMFIVNGTPGAQANFAHTMAMIQAVVMAGISLVYPVALLIVLSTRTSREYFKRLRTGMQ